MQAVADASLTPAYAPQLYTTNAFPFHGMAHKRLIVFDEAHFSPCFESALKCLLSGWFFHFCHFVFGALLSFSLFFALFRRSFASGPEKRKQCIDYTDGCDACFQ